MKSFEKIIRQRLMDKNMNIVKLAAELDTTPQTIYHLFRKNNPELVFLRKICHVLDLDIRKVVDEHEHTTYTHTPEEFNMNESTLHMLQVENKMLRQNLELTQELLAEIKKNK